VPRAAWFRAARWGFSPHHAGPRTVFLANRAGNAVALTATARRVTHDFPKTDEIERQHIALLLRLPRGRVLPAAHVRGISRWALGCHKHSASRPASPSTSRGSRNESRRTPPARPGADAQTLRMRGDAE